jgi:hypothetical protein
MLSPFIFYLKLASDANDDGAGMIKLDRALLHIELDLRLA